MKRFLSVFLTVAMLMAMIIMPTAAEDNNCLVFNGSGMGAVPGSSVFTSAYFYTETPYVSRDRDDPAILWDYMIVFDLYVDDYTNGDYQPGFVFSHEVGLYSTGYDFNQKAFVFDQRYMCNSNPADTKVLKTVGYDLEKGKWYEIGYGMNAGTVFFYVNGILVFEFDMLTETDDGFVGSVQGSVESGAYDGSDYLFLHSYEANLRFDNMTIYSGDYDFATGEATTTHISATEPTIDGDGLNFCGFGCGMSSTWYRSAALGTDKVTYDRAAAAAHVHDLQLIEHADPWCTTEGYDLVKCSCGMGQRENVLPALGHLPGFSSYTEAPTDTASGVDYKTCNRCYEEYVIVTPATSDAAKCLYLPAKASTHIYNGYLAINSDVVEWFNNGYAVSVDIMPEEHLDKKFAGHGAQMGDDTWAGYSYERGSFIIANAGSAEVKDDQIYAEFKYDLPKYEWATWTFVRDGSFYALYIDGVQMVAADTGKDVSHFIFLFNSHAANLYLDNFIIADPDYDLKTNTGIIYDYTDFNNGLVSQGMTEAELCGVIPFDEGIGTGWKSFNGGRPMYEFGEVHQDMAIFHDDKFDGTGGGYSQLPETAMNDFKAAFANGTLDFEYSYYFNATDWCEDEATLNGSTPYIGGYVNTEAFDSASKTYGGFAGYDFLRQQVIIGAVSSMWGGNFKTNDDGSIDGAAVDYEVKAGEWYKMTVSYKQDADYNIVVSVAMNDEVIATYTYEYIAMLYYIFYPNFVDCYIDNISVRVGANVYADNIDFTNGYTASNTGIDFSDFYTLVEGGVPTHVLTETKYPASCTTDGYTVYDCSCGETHYTLYNLAAPGHTWDDGVVTLEPTASTTGIKTYTCDVCGETKEEVLDVIIPEYILGDANGDGYVDTADIQILKRYLAGLSVTMTELAADINEDGFVDTADLQILQRYGAGLSTVLG